MSVGAPVNSLVMGRGWCQHYWQPGRADQSHPINATLIQLFCCGCSPEEAWRKVEIQAEVSRTHKKKAAAEKNVDTQTKSRKKMLVHKLQYQSLAFAVRGDGDSTCVKCS